MTANERPGGLSCAEVLARLSEFCDGGLPPAERAAVEVHVRDCPDCARFGGAFTAVLGRLRAHLRGEVATGAELDPGIASRLDEVLRRGR